MYRSINRKKGPATMNSRNYNLNELTAGRSKSKIWPALTKLVGLLPEQRGKLIGALLIMVVYSILSMLPPALIGYTINHLIEGKINTVSTGIPDQSTWMTHLFHGSGYSLIVTV